MNDATLKYLEGLPRDAAAASTLRALCGVLRDFGDSEQLRSLAYEAGRKLAEERPLGECADLAAFAEAADRSFRESGWGTLRAEADSEAVDFWHGAPPLAAWFGADHGEWCCGLFEGVLAEWLRQMGAGEMLAVRHVSEDGATDEVAVTLRYRFAHRAKLRVAQGSRA
jgi:hypothetical protein